MGDIPGEKGLHCRTHFRKGSSHNKTSPDIRTTTKEIWLQPLRPMPWQHKENTRKLLLCMPGAVNHLRRSRWCLWINMKRMHYGHIWLRNSSILDEMFSHLLYHWPQAIIQRTMISTWAIELFLDKLNSLEDSVANSNNSLVQHNLRDDLKTVESESQDFITKHKVIRHLMKTN